MADAPNYAAAISNIESGGKYGLLGPITKTGDRAYGKYQVMGENIPQWTKEVLGAPMTPQEFLSSPQAQDAVFQGKFGQYVNKYGPEGAAQAWFAGPGGVGKVNRTDQLGTSVGSYGKQFVAGLGSQGGTNNAPAPISGPQIPQQQPQQVAQPLNLAPQQESPPQQVAQIPVPAYTPPQPDMPQMAPPLSAPNPIQQYLHMAQMRQAFQKIPVPAGFTGFKYS
jgi:hypothetical protein